MQFVSIFRHGPRSAALALAGAAVLAAAPAAQAGDNVFWSIGVAAAPGVTVGVTNARPVYVQPAPVYVQPTPVIVHSPPRYVVPAPVYTQPHVHYGPPPVFYAPPQVVYRVPRYVGPPVYAAGWVPPGHRQREGDRRGYRHGHRNND